MARPLRLELAGGLYHITSRGDGREDIYRTDADRNTWLTVVDQVCQRYNWVCHAWCQMDNHYHLLIETPEANLSKGMRQLNGVYTQSFNRAHGRVGHVFQGRYKAILVERDSYLLELARYIVLNPLRAGMVKKLKPGPGAVTSPPAARQIHPIGCIPTGFWRSSDDSEPARFASTLSLCIKVRGCRACERNCRDRFIWVRKVSSRTCKRSSRRSRPWMKFRVPSVVR